MKDSNHVYLLSGVSHQSSGVSEQVVWMTSSFVSLLLAQVNYQRDPLLIGAAENDSLFD